MAICKDKGIETYIYNINDYFTQIWREYFNPKKSGHLPVPYNLIEMPLEIIFWVCKLGYKLFKLCKKTIRNDGRNDGENLEKAIDNNNNNEENQGKRKAKSDQKIYLSLMARLCERYIQTKNRRRL